MKYFVLLFSSSIAKMFLVQPIGINILFVDSSFEVMICLYIQTYNYIIGVKIS